MENRIFVKANCLVGNAWLACLVGHAMANYWCLVGHAMANYWCLVGMLGWPCDGQLLTNYWLTIDGQLFIGKSGLFQIKKTLDKLFPKEKNSSIIN
jgi:hypothetical protein